MQPCSVQLAGLQGGDSASGLCSEMKATANEIEFGQRLMYLNRTGLVGQLVIATIMNES